MSQPRHLPQNAEIVLRNHGCERPTIDRVIEELDRADASSAAEVLVRDHGLAEWEAERIVHQAQRALTGKHWEQWALERDQIELPA